MNKFDLINKVLVSDLDVKEKPLLVELIMRADDEWKCWPSIERLCKARGIKHERNFKGVDVYLPGLVTKVKRGRSYTYHINTSAVAELSDAAVTIKHTPALGTSETDTSAREEVNTSAVAADTSAVEGANSTYNNTVDSTEAPVVSDSPNYDIASPVLTVELPTLDSSFNYVGDDAVYVIDFDGVSKTEHDRHTSAVAEVYIPTRVLSPGEKKDFAQQVRIHRVSDEHAAQALALLQSGPSPKDFYTAVTDALVSVGAVQKEEVEVW